MSPPESELPQQCPVTEFPKHPSPLHFSINVTVPFGDLLAQPGQFCPFRGSERLLSDCSGVVDASSFVGDLLSEQVLA